jgi:hypothetical protein
MNNTEHLVALQSHLSNEKARLSAAKSVGEIAARKVIVSQIEKEIARECEFLAIDPFINAMSDDELLAELAA